MKFFMLSHSGDGLGLALRLRQAGHDVAVWLVDKRAKKNYDGLLTKPSKWEDFLDKETTVLFDSTGGGKTGDRLRAKGYNVLGGTVFADQLEIDRATAFEFLRQVGVKTPRSETFYSWDEGRAYAKRNKDQRLVFKASGKLADNDNMGTYVAYDAQDMVEMLDYFEPLATVPPEFELQDKIEGLAISTEGWFNGEQWMLPFNHTIEHKATAVGDLGPSAGCAFNIVWKTERNHIVRDGIERMAPLLKEFNYVGPIDLNTVVNEQGVWALEFTPRFGYDAFPSLLELWSGDVGEVLAQLARGQKVEQLPLQGGFASGLRMFIPPAPSEEFKPSGGIPIRGFERGDRPHLWFFDVMLDDTNKLVSSPGYANVVCITGVGKTIQEAFEEPYRLAEKARVPEKFYRTDAVEELCKDYCEFERLVEVVSGGS